MTGLILAAHGSHISPDTAGIVWSYIDQLRQWGVADEITACFWKESPAFNQVLDTLESDEIVVVPVFTATGYFSQTVIPAEMNLTGPFTHRAGRTIHYTRTIGEHPYLNQIVRQRIADVIEQAQLDENDIAIAVIGHGTPRSKQSQDAARQQAAQLRDHFASSEIVSVYLDDEPSIPSIYQTTQSPVIIAVPFFLAPGSHVTQDVPQALGLAPNEVTATVQGRRVYYTPPIGTHDVICHIIVELARETGLMFEINQTDNQWAGFPKRGCTELAQVVSERSTLQFGQLELSATEVHHALDESAGTTIHDPSSLRKLTRENPFRPLPTACDLPGGWVVPVANVNQLDAVVETVYPGAVSDWAFNRQGRFRAETLAEVGVRQTGMFRTVTSLTAETIRYHVDSTCGNCVRHPTWYFRKTESDDIPCKSPCNVWLSRAVESL